VTTRRKPCCTAKRTAHPPRIRVLVVLSPDGFCEVYGPLELSACIVNRLDVERPEEVLADQYLDSILPRAFREIYWPRNLRATGQVVRRTATDERERRFQLDFVRVCRSIREESTPAAIAKARRAAG